jgi:hypothetical protein
MILRRSLLASGLAFLAAPAIVPPKLIRINAVVSE